MTLDHRCRIQGGAMYSRKTRTARAGVTMAAVLTVFLAAASSWNWRAAAQEGASVPPAKDYNQRSLEIYEFRKAAKSGPDRGQEIFYYKCWFCHNEYTKGAPQLKGLYSHP